MTEEKAILLIDNDNVQRKIIESALRPHGYRSIHAKDGAAALKILETNRPGLVLLSISIPGSNGFRVLKNIRDTDDVPIIVLSVFDELEYKVKAMDFGADDYITKPFELNELVSRVNALFAGNGAASEEIEAAGLPAASGTGRLKRYGELPGAGFRIVNSKKCPLYEYGDQFELSGLSFKTPRDKTTCISLVRNIEDFMRFRNAENPSSENGANRQIYCGGCAGSVKLEYVKIREPNPFDAESEVKINNTVLFLSRIPLFQWFDRETIKDLVLSMSLKKYTTGSVLIQSGESAKFLYTIVSGSVDVLDDSDKRIARLGTGDVIGEISLISGDPVEAKISVAESSIILKLDGYYFRKVLNRNPAIQLYLSRLLARRPAISDIAENEVLDAGRVEKLTVMLPPVLKHCSMMGKLDDIVPSILLQMLNMNQQTGILSLELTGGKGLIYFRDGEIVEAEYDQKDNIEAFYEIMKQKEGRFKFTPSIPDDKANTPLLGSFMGLLMEGVRLADEEKAQ